MGTDTAGSLMKHTNLSIVKPSDMNEKQKQELVSLHQKYITLSQERILDYLKNRDQLYLYYLKDTKQLIATAGVQFVVCNNKVFIYIGNTVVEERYSHEGCLSHVIMKSLLFSYLRYPFKKKYWCALTSSPGSFSYAQRFQPCWPNVKEKTPQKMLDVMEQCINQIGVNNYKLNDGQLITYDLSYEVKETFHSKPKNINCINASFFNQINPGAYKGEQLFFVNECQIYKLINACIYSLHHKLIRKPKLYHSLKKKRLTHPLLSSFLIIINLIPRTVKWAGAAVLVALLYFGI